MVARNSQAIQTPGVSRSQIQNSQVAAATPDVNAHIVGGSDPVSARSSVSNDLQDNAFLDVLFKTGARVAEHGIKISQQEAMMAGAAAAARGESEATLQLDPLTANWSRAGYRDTMGRLAMARREADIAANMATLREQSPEKMEEFLAKSRSTLEAQFGGMSLEARQAMVGQILTSDQSALQTHRKEHAKFIIDQHTQSLSANTGVLVNALDGSKDDVGAYAANTNKLLMFTYGSVVQDPSLPFPVKQNMIEQVAEFALAGNHQLIYEQLRNEEMPLPNGTTGNILSLLPLDKQTQLSEKYRQSLKQTEAYRNGDYLNSLAAWSANLQNPSTPKGTAQESHQFLLQGVNNGTVSASEYVTKMTQYYTAANKQMNQAGRADAYLKGDNQTLANLGATQEEGLEALRSSMQASNMPIQQQLATLSSAGMRGSVGAFAEVGKLLRPAMNEVMAGKGVSSTNANALGELFQTVENAERAGQRGAFTLVQSGLSDEQQTALAWIRDEVKTNGRTVEEASQIAVERIARDAALPPDARRRLANDPNRTKEDAKLVAEIGERGPLDTIWSHLKFWSADAANARSIEPFRAPFQNSAAADQAVARAQLQISEELVWIGERNPSLTGEQRMSKALASLSQRTVKTADGPMFLPRGADPSTVFGTPTNVGNERIGLALDELTAPLKGDAAAMTYRVQANGRVLVERLDASGQFMGSDEIDPKDVGAMVQTQRNREAAEANILIGSGQTVKTQHGSVTYTGLNTAAVDPKLMSLYRANLIDHEGVRSSPYDDLSGRGIRTGGVGVSSTNTHFPKGAENREWTQAEIDLSFQLASNEAASAGKSAMRELQLPGAAAFLLLSELAYQSGPGFLSASGYKDLATALAKRDKAAAQAAIKETPAYKWTGAKSNRRQFYERSIDNIFKE